MTDFIFDGKHLSDYGFILCDFVQKDSFSFTSAGSLIKFNKNPRYSGEHFVLVNTEYGECISAEFDICKNPDIFEDDLVITNDEYSGLVRWLNRREFLRFQAIDDYTGKSRYYNASFNIQKIELDDKLYGLRLTMETDRPFGYGEEQKISFDFEEADAIKVLSNVSEEIGTLYPDLAITCNENGTLCLYNELEECTMVIKNCTAGEVITIDGQNQIISTSLPSHRLSRDFNFEFFRIGNLMNNRDNVIRSSMPCHIDIGYTPIIKDVP